MKPVTGHFIAKNRPCFGSKNMTGSPTANTTASAPPANKTAASILLSNSPTASTLLSSKTVASTLLLVLLVLVGFSCAPPAEFIDESIEPTASGPPIRLSQEVIPANDIILTWSPPIYLGTKIGGRLLQERELAYQVYFIEREMDASSPTAEEIKTIAMSASPAQKAGTARGITNAQIENLESGSRYFLVVETYNSFAATSTLSREIVEVIMPIRFVGDLSFTKTEHELMVYDSSFTITPDTKPSVSSTLPSSISYSLEKIEGTFDDTIIDVSEIRGNVMVYPTVTGTMKFAVIAEAEGYFRQEVLFEIRILPRVSGAVTRIRIESSGIENHSFNVQWTAPAERGTKQDGTRLEPEDLVYRVYYVSGNVDDPDPEVEVLVQDARVQSQIEESQGLTNVQVLDLRSGTLYFVAVETYNVFTEVSTFSGTVAKATTTTGSTNFTGMLSYNQTEYSYPVGSPVATINPKTKPTATSGTTISYGLYRRGGVQFSDSTITINLSTGVITVDPNATMTSGAVNYRVFARATGFNTQYIEMTIRITQIGLEVTPYYSQEPGSVVPVPLGLALRDDSLADDDVVLSIESSGFSSELGGGSGGEYKIHIEDEREIYDTSGYGTFFTKTPINNRITLSKLEIEEVTGRFLLNGEKVFIQQDLDSVDGNLVGLSGPGIAGIQEIAIYRPGEIRSWQDFQAMRYNMYHDYVLKNDIVFPEAAEGTSNFETIGNDNRQFWGTLDGGGFSITGIRIEGDDSHVGLFGYMYTGLRINRDVVKDLTLIDCTFIGKTNVGSIAGVLTRGVIRNVRAETSRPGAGRVEGRGGDNVGGLVGVTVDGLVYGSSNVPVKGFDRVGGLVGYHYGGGRTAYYTGQGGVVSGYSTGDVTGTINIGGLVGMSVSNNGTTVIGYATGDVTGIEAVGGLVGTSNFGSGQTKGYATGNVTGGLYVGGLVGFVQLRANITGYSTGNVTAIESAGGMFGFVSSTILPENVLVGYSRSTVFRSEGNNSFFGKIIGWNYALKENVSSIRSRIYSSEGRSPESELYNADRTRISGATGENGNPVNINGINDISLFSEVFSPDEITDWIWMGKGKWPALDLGDIISPSDQPID